MKKLLENIKNWWFGAKVPGDPQGISEFKSIIKNTLSLIVTVKQAKEDDGKIKGMEWIGIGKAALPFVGNIKNYKLLKAQAVDFKTAEGIELAQYCAELGILPKDAEFAIKHAISAIEKALDAYIVDIVPIIAVIKNKKEV